MENRIRPLWVIILLLSGIIIGLYINKGVNTKKVEVEGGSKFDEVMWYVGNDYVEEPNAQEIQDEAIAAMMEKLDPHSAYVPLEEFNEVNDPLLGSFDGIGVQFRLERDTIAIVSVIKGGPSEKVGLMDGDRIIYVDDTLVASKKLKNEDVMRKLKGPKGTKVRVRVLRRGVEGLLDYTITRDAIPTYSVDIAYMLDDEIGYLKLSKFSATTVSEFKKGIGELDSQGMKKLIFDLRGNTGGYLQSAVQIANEFLPKNRLIVYTQGRKSPRQEYRSDGRGSYQQIPLVILIDEASASASEILAGAIQDNDRGTIIGRRSFGKGLVQQPIAFADQSMIRLTIARYYSPSGRCIQKPYTSGDNKDYEEDIMTRYIHGEFFSQDSIKHEGKEYHTKNGRPVYGGGGITPDIFVAEDTTDVTSYYKQASMSGLIIMYAYSYTDENRGKLSKMDNVSEMATYLKHQNIVDKFATYADKNGLRRRNLMIQRSHKLLERYIISRIIYNMMKEEAWIEYLNSDDPAITATLKVMREGKAFPKKK